MVNMKEKELKQITKAYSKRFKLLNKNICKSYDVGLQLFVEHLKYLRDTAILIAVEADQESAICTTAASLIMATAEFDAYQNEENLDKKDFHWENFCECLKLNGQEWLVPNDTI